MKRYKWGPYHLIEHQLNFKKKGVVYVEDDAGRVVAEIPGGCVRPIVYMIGVQRIKRFVAIMNMQHFRFKEDFGKYSDEDIRWLALVSGARKEAKDNTVARILNEKRKKRRLH